MNKNRKNKKGFSLMEVMISLAVLVVGLVAIISFVSKSFQLSAESRNQVIAVQLAQEGLELALNLRDTRKLNNENYDFINYDFHDDDDVIVLGVNTGGAFGTIDYYTGSIEPAGYSTTYVLNYNNGYRHATGGIPTKFKRTMRFWYGGDSKNYGGSSLNTCSSTVYSIVYWGESEPEFDSCNFANKCAVASMSVEVEKDPNNPKCGTLIAGSPITYP